MEHKQLALFPNPYYHEYVVGGKWANECKICEQHMFDRRHHVDQEEMNHE